MNIKQQVLAALEGLEKSVFEETLQEYMNDILEVEYTKTLNGYFKGVKLLVTFGSPDVYINTMTNKIEGYWGNEYFEETLPYELGEAINDYIEELI